MGDIRFIKRKEVCVYCKESWYSLWCYLLVHSVEQNAKIYTEIEVAYHYAKNFNYAAVTGTDGKTTVTTLLYEMLNRQKKSSLLETLVRLCANWL